MREGVKGMPEHFSEKLYGEATSPNGRWVWGFVSMPVREGYIDRLFILDALTREIEFSFGEDWSARAPTWNSDQLTVAVRCYPGSHEPSELLVTIDLTAQTARHQTMDPTWDDIPLSQLDFALKRAVTWRVY